MEEIAYTFIGVRYINTAVLPLLISEKKEQSIRGMRTPSLTRVSVRL